MNARARECATRRRARTTDGDGIDDGRVRDETARDDETDDDDDDDERATTNDARDGRAFREGRADARRARGRARRWTTRRERTRTIEGWWTRRCARRESRTRTTRDANAGRGREWASLGR
jgi:hypothetical protein